MRRPLCHCWIKRGATLLDGRKVKAGGVGDGLQNGGIAGVPICARDGGMLPGGQSRNRLRKNKIGLEVGVMVSDAVASPPTGVHRELHEISEAADGLVGAGGLTAGESAEGFEADRRRTLRDQIGVQEVLVREFIVGVVFDVLCHVAVELSDGVGVESVTAGGVRWIALELRRNFLGNFVVLSAGEFLVL